MPDWGVSAMVDIPTLVRTKSLRKATTVSVDSGLGSDESPTNPAPTADPPNVQKKPPNMGVRGVTTIAPEKVQKVK